jgi:glucokinase
MYLGIDIGGTKTLLASLDDNGVITEQFKFPTNPDYPTFLDDIERSLGELKTKDFRAATVAAPGRVDREHGRTVAFGNLPWHNLPLQDDIERLVNCPTLLENDANLGALSEAMLLKGKYSRVLYTTISTGIGSGFVVDQKIEPNLADIEAGQIILEYRGKHVKWESFASGHAIVERYHQKAAEINDEAIWQQIAYDLALGFNELIAIVEPEVIVMGGSVGVYFKRYGDYLVRELKKYDNPLTPIPPFLAAQRPEEAVVYGCYDLARSVYGRVAA